MAEQLAPGPAAPELQYLPCQEMMPIPMRKTGSHWADRQFSFGRCLSKSHRDADQDVADHDADAELPHRVEPDQ